MKQETRAEQEIRAIQESEFNVEFREDGGIKSIVGMGIVFGARSVNLGGFFEEIDERAYNDRTDVSDVVGLFNHDANFVLGRTSSNTMKLEKTKKGVRYIINPPDTQTIRDLVAEPIKRGDIKGSSFAFQIARQGDQWREDENGVIIRTIIDFARISDMSPVTYPAYPTTTVATRSLEEYKTSKYNPILFNARSRELAFLNL